jgi:hypothetical protein
MEPGGKSDFGSLDDRYGKKSPAFLGVNTRPRRAGSPPPCCAYTGGGALHLDDLHAVSLQATAGNDALPLLLRSLDGSGLLRARHPALREASALTAPLPKVARPQTAHQALIMSDTDIC